MCGLLENGNLFLWMPGSEGSPVFHTTPLNGLKMDANDWKGWTSVQTVLFSCTPVPLAVVLRSFYESRLLFVLCLCH